MQRTNKLPCRQTVVLSTGNGTLPYILNSTQIGAYDMQHSFHVMLSSNMPQKNLLVL
uniref:Uncharacterized protein n=1 Tax=Arundo donax TaxID=35708 RepID=A0A0A9FU98_ARUDO